MARSLVHPRLQAQLAEGDRFYPSLCTIVATTDDRDAAGQPIGSTTTVLLDEPCRISPAGGGERRGRLTTVLTATHRVAFNAYHDDLDATMTAIVDGTWYNILLVQHDGQSNATYLDVEVVSG